MLIFKNKTIEQVVNDKPNFGNHSFVVCVVLHEPEYSGCNYGVYPMQPEGPESKPRGVFTELRDAIAFAEHRELFSLTQLVSFGHFLVSSKRRERFEATQEDHMLSLEERLAVVGDWDIANWMEEQSTQSA